MLARTAFRAAFIVLVSCTGAFAQSQPHPDDARRDQAAPAVRADSAVDSPAVTLVTELSTPQRPASVQTARTRFGGRFAVGFDTDDDAVVVYDLRDGQWFDWTNRKWISSQAAEAWAEASRQRSTASIARPGYDEQLKRFVAAQLAPTFKVEEGDHRLTLSNDVFTYAVTTQPLPANLARPFMTQQRLSAYFNAMTDRKVAPFPLLAVLKELESRGVYPERMEITIRIKGTEQKLVTTLRLDPPDADHDKRIAAALALTDTPPPDAAAGDAAPTPPGGREAPKPAAPAEAEPRPR